MKRFAVVTLCLAGLGGALFLLKHQEPASLSVDINAPAFSGKPKLNPAMPKQLNATSVSSPTAARKQENAELSSTDRKVFFKELETVFGTLAVSGAPASTINTHLARLNSRGATGLSAVVAVLNTPAADDSQVKQRLFFVDYLSYRMRWDAAAKDAVTRLATASIPLDTPLRYRATTIAEQSELIEALIRNDFETGVAIVKAAQVPQLRRLGVLAVYEHLLNSGLSTSEAVTKVRAVDPTFKI